MLIDLCWILLIVLGAFKGSRKGFILALFSLLGLVAGIIAAMKLSAFVAVRLESNIGAGNKWIPALSFLIVFIIVAFLVSIAGRMIQKSFETVSLGWLNRISGAALFIILYSIIFSVILFYLVNLKIISAGTVSSSKLYVYLSPIAAAVMEKLGNIIPFLKDVFMQLEAFFEGVGKNLEH